MKRFVAVIWVLGFLSLMVGMSGFASFRFLASGQSNPGSPAAASPAKDAKTPPPADQAAQAPTQMLPGKMVFDDPDRKLTVYAGGKGKTPFDHAQHVAVKTYTCQTCHHTNSKTLTQKLEEYVPQCATCHKAGESPCDVEGDFKDKQAVSSEDAFHGKSDSVTGAAGCKVCHLKLDKKVFPNVKDITSKCTLCHTGNDS